MDLFENLAKKRRGIIEPATTGNSKPKPTTKSLFETVAEGSRKLTLLTEAERIAAAEKVRDKLLAPVKPKIDEAVVEKKKDIIIEQVGKSYNVRIDGQTDVLIICNSIDEAMADGQDVAEKLGANFVGVKAAAETKVKEDAINEPKKIEESNIPDDDVYRNLTFEVGEEVEIGATGAQAVTKGCKTWNKAKILAISDDKKSVQINIPATGETRWINRFARPIRKIEAKMAMSQKDWDRTKPIGHVADESKVNEDDYLDGIMAKTDDNPLKDDVPTGNYMGDLVWRTMKSYVDGVVKAGKPVTDREVRKAVLADLMSDSEEVFDEEDNKEELEDLIKRVIAELRLQGVKVAIERKLKESKINEIEHKPVDTTDDGEMVVKDPKADAEPEPEEKKIIGEPKKVESDRIKKEKEAPDSETEQEKRYIGQGGENHYYMIAEESGNLQLVDQEGKAVYPSKEKPLETKDPREFIQKVMMDVEIDTITRDIVLDFIIPKEEEKPEAEEVAEEQGLEDIEGEKPENTQEAEPPPHPVEKERTTRESKIDESVKGKLLSAIRSNEDLLNSVAADLGVEGEEILRQTEMMLDEVGEDELERLVTDYLVDESKTLIEMKVSDGTNEFEVSLTDDGSLDTVIAINGREFRFDSEFASMWKDAVNDKLSEEGLRELALDAISNMEPEEYEELLNKAGFPDTTVDKPSTGLCKEEEDETWVKGHDNEEFQVTDEKEEENIEESKVNEKNDTIMCDVCEEDVAEKDIKVDELGKVTIPENETKMNEDKKWAEEVYGNFEEYKKLAMKDPAFAVEYERAKDDGETGTFEEWLKERWEVLSESKAQHRGKVVFPAERSKDKKDHFPINNIAQARNALSRSHQYKSAPSWYSGSLTSLQNSVRRAVKKAYPSIEIKESTESINEESVDAKDAAYDEGFVNWWMKDRNKIPAKDRTWGSKDLDYETAQNIIRELTSPIDKETLAEDYEKYQKQKNESKINESKTRDMIDPSRGADLLRKLLKRDTI